MSDLHRLLMGLFLVAMYTTVVQAEQGAKSRPLSSCPLQDEGEGEGEGEVEAQAGAGRGGGMTRHVVPLVAAALIAAGSFGRRRLSRRWQTVGLATCAVLAVGNYTDFGRWPGERYVNGWEFYHYYLGSKYLPELGHTQLYAATILADIDSGRKFAHPKDAIRNLTTGKCIPVNQVLRQRERVLERFTPQRWTEFTGDVRYFKSTLSQYRWDHLFHDKGYNATPIWSTLVGRLTNAVPTSSHLGLLILSLIDPVLMLCAMIFIWYAFGVNTALLAIVLVGTHMTMSHSHMKGALLRTDWIMTLVMAICALKVQRPALAGGLAAWAACSRVFPGGFALVPLGIVGLALMRREPARASLLRFSVAFMAAATALVTLSFIVVGPTTWAEFIHKIVQHNDQFSPWRVGFKHVFLGAYEFREVGTHQAVFHDRWLAWWIIQLAVLSAVILLSRHLADWQTLAIGFVPTFFAVAPTYYYYIMLIVPLLFFAGRGERPECTIGILWLLLSSSIAYVIHDAVGRDLILFFTLSCMILGVCILMFASVCFESRRRPAPILQPASDLPDMAVLSES